MRYLRRIGLVLSLVIVGVLGGLMAPLSSEAVPTVTLQVDGGNPTSILITTSATCNATERALGYTACYAIRTGATPYAGTNAEGVTRSYKIQNATGATARLRVADTKGQDKFSLVGVQFVPVEINWGTGNDNEKHVLTFSMENLFSSSVNVKNAGTYKWALRTGGMFIAGPTTAVCTNVNDHLCDAINDKVEFSGQGIFETANNNTTRVDILSPAGSAQNSQPLSFTVGGPHEDPILSYAGLTNADMGQVDPTYPQFACTNGVAASTTQPKCLPNITQTMTVTLYGPDTFVLVDGQTGVGANCVLSADDKEDLNDQIRFLKGLVRILDTIEDHHHNSKLRAFITRMEELLATIITSKNSDCPGTALIQIAFAIEQARDQVAFNAAGAVVAVAAPETGTGTITIVQKVTPPGLYTPFVWGFTGTGFGIDPSFTITTPAAGEEHKTFSSLATGVAGGARKITQTTLPPLIFPASWTTSSVSCESLLYGPTSGAITTWSTNTVPNYVNVEKLGDGDTLTCTFTNNFEPGIT